MSRRAAYNGATGAEIAGATRHTITRAGVFPTAIPQQAAAGPAPSSAFKPQTNSL